MAGAVEAFAQDVGEETAETRGGAVSSSFRAPFCWPRRPIDLMGGGIPSIASVPFVLAAAIATRSKRRRLADKFASSVGAAGTTGSEDRTERAARLSQVTYDDLLQDRVAYRTPDIMLARLRQLRDELGLTGIIMKSNVGGQIPVDSVLNSIRLFAREVAPRLRAGS